MSLSHYLLVTASAIYQVLSLAARALGAVAGCLGKHQPSVHVLVVLPLISLMRDQVTKLCLCGLQAMVIWIDQVNKEELLACQFTHIFAGPEAVLQGEKWRSIHVYF